MIKSLTVLAAIKVFKSDLKEIVSDINYAVKDSTAFALQAIEGLISSLEVAYRNELDQTFDQLDDSVESTFIKVNETIDKLIEALDDTTNDLSDIVSDCRRITDSLPFKGSDPRIYKYTSQLIPIGEDKSIDLTITGCNLKQKLVRIFYLEDSSVEAKLIRETNDELKFRITSEDIDVIRKKEEKDETEAVLAQFNLEIDIRKFFFKNKLISFPLEITVFPSLIGSCFLSIRVKGHKYQEEQVNTQYFSLESHKTSPKENLELFTVAGIYEGWKIQRSSLEFNTVENRRNRSSYSFSNVTDTSFCVKLFAKPKYSGYKKYRKLVRGKIEGYVTYTRYRLRDQFEEYTFAKKDIYWGKEFSINIPDKVKVVDSFDFTVNLFNGRQVVLTRANSTIKGLVSVEAVPDKNPRKIIVRPVLASQAQLEK